MFFYKIYYTEEDNNTCVSDTRSCTITNGIGTQTWNGTSWNTCTIVTCNAGYYDNTTTCEPQWTGDGNTTGYLFKNTSGVEQYPLSCSDLLVQTTWKNTLVGTPWNGSSFNDGVYYIKPTTDPAFQVYCDMTTDGGGWTRIIKDYTTTLSDLLLFGDTSEIASTFYSDSTYGIGWGANDSINRSFIINIPSSYIKIKFSGFYNNPTGGMGTIFIHNDLSETIFSFSDSWAYDPTGQLLQINGTYIYYQVENNETNRIENFTYNITNSLKMFMKGYTGYPYTKRYIGELWIK